MSRSSALFLDAMASIGCIVCRRMGLGFVPAEIHHIGDTSERNDFLTIPACTEHHRGATGFHGLGEREFNRRYKTNELMLHGEALAVLFKERIYP